MKNQLKNNMAKKKKEKKKKKVTGLKIWMIENGVTQRELRERMAIGTGTANRIVNEGKASESVIRHLALELGFSYENMLDMLKVIK